MSLAYANTLIRSADQYKVCIHLNQLKEAILSTVNHARDEVFLLLISLTHPALHDLFNISLCFWQISIIEQSKKHELTLSTIK